jgi:tRNA pseudouridine55 synthase
MDMNGILIVNKPINVTSRDVVNKLNHIFHTKKIGHTGTLDPIATGVLVVAIGSYTKLVNMLTSLDKEYIAEIKLGVKTDTLDITGNILEQNDDYNITREDIINVFSKFPKEYEQEVPAYSAVKINGKKLYEYARNNEVITLPKRNVNIYSLELISFENNIIKFKTHVSKGTYIRSLIADICSNLNVIGTMNSLERTKQGIFDINDSIDLDNINEETNLLTTEDVLDVNKYDLDENLYKLVINGNKINLNLKNGLYNMYYDNKCIALYELTDNIARLLMFYSRND